MKKRILALAGVLALVAVLVTPMAALAVTTDDTDVGGPLSTDVLEITPPSEIILTDLYGSGADVSGTSVTAGTVLCTDPDGYSLAIVSDDPDGHLSLGGAHAVDLTTTLKVTPTLVTGDGATVADNGLTGVTVTTTPQVVGTTSAGAPGATDVNSITLGVAQPPQITGTAGTYSIVLTFTVTAN